MSIMAENYSISIELREELENISGWKIPEHDVLSWLLRKLPKTIWEEGNAGKERPLEMTSTEKPETWSFYYKKAAGSLAKTPEDACAKLLIGLIKQGVIKP